MWSARASRPTRTKICGGSTASRRALSCTSTASRAAVCSGKFQPADLLARRAAHPPALAARRGHRHRPRAELSPLPRVARPRSAHPHLLRGAQFFRRPELARRPDQRPGPPPELARANVRAASFRRRGDRRAAGRAVCAAFSKGARAGVSPGHAARRVRRSRGAAARTPGCLCRPPQHRQGSQESARCGHAGGRRFARGVLGRRRGAGGKIPRTGESWSRRARRVSRLSFAGRIATRPGGQGKCRRRRAPSHLLQRQPDLPAKALDYLSHGLPVIASDLPSNRSVLGEAALYIPPADTAALRATLLALLDDPAAYRQRSALAWARGQELSSTERARGLIAWLSTDAL